MSGFQEFGQCFQCGDDHLYGILSLPAQPARRGVVMVVGGPQYRAGSHRQFTLLARHLAEQGVPVLRFDYRGMGDSDGAMQSFENAGDDLRAAVDHFMLAVPGLQEIVLWGLCDAASAAVLYAHQDARVTGLVLLNPWVRTEAGIARATLKHYYVQRLFERSLWKKIAGGGFDLRAALVSLFQLVRATRVAAPLELASTDALAANPAPLETTASLPDRMYRDLFQFTGKVLVICSGADLTGREFTDLASSSKQWRSLMNQTRFTIRSLAGADHTFSCAQWREQAASWTTSWLGAEI